MKKMTKDLAKQQSSLGRLFGANRFNNLFEDLNAMMDYAWNDFNLDINAFNELQPKASFPKINVSETDDSYEVEIAISGFDKDDLSLEFKDSCLFVKADKNSESSEEDSNKKYLKREISNRSFRRVVKFPNKIDSSNIKSHFDSAHCLVVCELPKLSEVSPEIVKIEIE